MTPNTHRRDIHAVVFDLGGVLIDWNPFATPLRISACQSADSPCADRPNMNGP